MTHVRRCPGSQPKKMAAVSTRGVVAVLVRDVNARTLLQKESTSNEWSLPRRNLQRDETFHGAAKSLVEVSQVVCKTRKHERTISSQPFGGKLEGLLRMEHSLVARRSEASLKVVYVAAVDSAPSDDKSFRWFVVDEILKEDAARASEEAVEWTKYVKNGRIKRK